MEMLLSLLKADKSSVLFERSIICLNVYVLSICNFFSFVKIKSYWKAIAVFQQLFVL